MDNSLHDAAALIAEMMEDPQPTWVECAKALNSAGLKTARGNPWEPVTARGFAVNYGLKVPKRAKRKPAPMTLSWNHKNGLHIPLEWSIPQAAHMPRYGRERKIVNDCLR